MFTFPDLNLEPYGNFLLNSYNFRYIHVCRGLHIIVGGLTMLFT
jgi:hypothetical protein